MLLLDRAMSVPLEAPESLHRAALAACLLLAARQAGLPDRRVPEPVSDHSMHALTQHTAVPCCGCSDICPGRGAVVGWPSLCAWHMPICPTTWNVQGTVAEAAGVSPVLLGQVQAALLAALQNDTASISGKLVHA